MFKDLKNVKETYPDGTRYEGDKKEDKKHGRGTFWYLDGGYYEGQWREDKLAGRGNMYNKSNNLLFQGDWVDDK